jgi:hypothetical protein
MPKTLDSSTLRWAQIWRAYSSCGSWANLASSWKESFSNWAMVVCRGDGCGSEAARRGAAQLKKLAPLCGAMRW